MALTPSGASKSSLMKFDFGASISSSKVLHDCDEGVCIAHLVMNLKHNSEDGASALTFKSAAWLWWRAPVFHIPSLLRSMILIMAPTHSSLKVLHECDEGRLYSTSRHEFSTWSWWWRQHPHLHKRDNDDGVPHSAMHLQHDSDDSSLGRYVFGSEISYNKAPPRLPGLGC